MSLLSARIPNSLRGIWGEYGAWAVVLPCCAAGLAAYRPPSAAALLLLPAVVLLTAAKGLVQRVRRTGQDWGMLASFVLAALLCALPAAIAAPWVAGTIVLAAAPFGALYLWVAGDPRWTRSLGVELAGTVLLTSSCLMAAAASRPDAARAAVLLWAAVGSLFPPGVLRARLRKAPTAALRAAVVLCAAGGLAVQAALAHSGRLAPWGLASGSVFLGDLWSAWALPQWSTRKLGAILTIRYSAAALVLALAWRATI